MGFFSRVVNRIATFFSTSLAAETAYGLLEKLFPYGQMPKRGTRELLQTPARLPWMHTAIWKIAFDVARTEFILYRANKATQMRSARREIKRKGLQRGYELKSVTELEEHPFLDMLDNPNPYLGCVITYALIEAYLDTKGEVPIVIERATDGKPLELWPVPPHWLVQMPTVGSPFWHFSWMGWTRDVPEADVLYLRRPNLELPYGRGSGAGEALADELDIDEFAAKHMKSFFFNRALPEAFVSITGTAGGKKSEEVIDAFEKKLEEKHRGVGKAWRPHFTNGTVSVQQVGSSLKDQQMKELRNLERDTLLQVFGIPPECVGIVENSNRATINSAIYIYALNVLLPRLVLLCDGLTPLAKEWDSRLILGFESPVEEDYEFNLRVMTAQPTLFTKNEWRELAEMPSIPSFGDDFAEAGAAPPGAAPSGGTNENTPNKPEPPPAEVPEPEENPEPKAAPPRRRRAA